MKEFRRWRIAFLVSILIVGACISCANTSSQTDRADTEDSAADLRTASEVENTAGEGSSRRSEDGYLLGEGYRCAVKVSDRGRGTPGDDELNVKDGETNIFGGEGDDVVSIDSAGASGSKIFLIGGGGSDHIYGGFGDDILYGDGFGYPCESLGAKEPGYDVLEGGPGRDQLLGGNGEDILRGGRGDDMLDSGGLNTRDGEKDYLYCGPGEDFYSSRESIDYVAPDCENLNNIVY